MTKMRKYTTTTEQFKELFIKNMPSQIKGGNEKHLSNINIFPTIQALKSCKFINFNTKERVSFMVFDIDKIGKKSAIDYFKTIDNFFEYLSTRIGYEPTYILMTDNGFHFAYHLKNHVYTSQEKSLKYLIDIKRTISEILKCDDIASNRLNGVWRNPFLHKYYYSECINYELSDFEDLLQVNQKKCEKGIFSHNKINYNEIQKGNRNIKLFEAAMRFSKGKYNLTIDDICNYISNINCNFLDSLENSELHQISKSTYSYWRRNSIKFGSIQNNENLNIGIMGFKKMKNLSYFQYMEETKRRQSLAAHRTNSIKKNKRESIMSAKNIYINMQKDINKKIVQESIHYSTNLNQKITVSSISRITKLNRRTVKKYINDFL